MCLSKNITSYKDPYLLLFYPNNIPRLLTFQFVSRVSFGFVFLTIGSGFYSKVGSGSTQKRILNPDPNIHYLQTVFVCNCRKVPLASFICIKQQPLFPKKSRLQSNINFEAGLYSIKEVNCVCIQKSLYKK